MQVKPAPNCIFDGVVGAGFTNQSVELRDISLNPPRRCDSLLVPTGTRIILFNF